MIAYACSPKKGGEHLLGWNWTFRLVERGHYVTVLTVAHRLTESDGRRPAKLQMIGVEDNRFVFLYCLGLLGLHLFYQFWNRLADT